jgi:hypothetical protein
LNDEEVRGRPSSREEEEEGRLEALKRAIARMSLHDSVFNPPSLRLSLCSCVFKGFLALAEAKALRSNLGPAD